MNGLQPGDHLAVPALAYTHHGIYVGADQVIHYQGPFTCPMSSQVIISPLAEFQGDAPIRVIHHTQRPHFRMECVARAYARLGENEYNLLFNNCEHFVLWCIEDKHNSPQVTRFAAAVVAAELLQRNANPITRVAASVGAGSLAGSTLGSVMGSTAASPTLLSMAAPSAVASLATLGTAPVLAPLAVGTAVAYGVYKLFQWATD